METLLKNNFIVCTDPDDLINASCNGSKLEEEIKNLFLNKRISRTEFSILVTRVRSMSTVLDNIGVQTVPNENSGILSN